MPRLGLQVDGGTPPPPPDERDASLPPDEAGVVVASQMSTVDEDPGWTRETVRSLMAIPFLGLHLIAARRGPEDSWLPDDAELDVMAAPLHNMLARSMRLRPLARFGDGIAFATATGTYAVAESRRIARWRAEHGDEPPPPPPDYDLAGLGTTEHLGGQRPTVYDEPAPAPGSVRPWRPPSIQHDA